jgi:hypothetical protein
MSNERKIDDSELADISGASGISELNDGGGGDSGGVAPPDGGIDRPIPGGGGDSPEPRGNDGPGYSEPDQG